jgi:hypothetical protein
MIIDEEQLKPTAGHLHRVPSIPNHNTLICEVDEGDGKDLPVDVQSLDNMGTPSSSCYTEFSRGFEYGAHDYVWSLQAGIRQSVAVKEVIVSAIDIDKRTKLGKEEYATFAALNEGRCIITPDQAQQLNQRYAEIDQLLMSSLERWEAMEARGKS